MEDENQGPEPLIGWAVNSKVPPGWSDPERRPGYKLQTGALVVLVMAGFLSVVGNWVASQPADDSGALARSSEGDALMGLAALLYLVALLLMITWFVEWRRTRQRAVGTPQAHPSQAN